MEEIDIYKFLKTTYLSVVTFTDRCYNHNVAYAFAAGSLNRDKPIYIITDNIQELNTKIENERLNDVFTVSYEDISDRENYTKVAQSLIIYDSLGKLFNIESYDTVVKYLCDSNNCQVVLADADTRNEHIKKIIQDFEDEYPQILPQLLSFNLNINPQFFDVKCVPTLLSVSQQHALFGTTPFPEDGNDAISYEQFLKNGLNLDKNYNWLYMPKDFGEVVDEDMNLPEYLQFSPFGKSLRFYNNVYPFDIQQKIFSNPEVLPGIPSLLEALGIERVLGETDKIKGVKLQMLIQNIINTLVSGERNLIYTAFDDIFGAELIENIFEYFNRNDDDPSSIKFKVVRLSEEDDETILKDKIDIWNIETTNNILIVANPKVIELIKENPEFKIKNINNFHILDFELGRAYNLALETFKDINYDEGFSTKFQVYLYYSLIPTNNSLKAMETANYTYMNSFSNYLEQIKEDKQKRYNMGYKIVLKGHDLKVLVNINT